MLILNVLKLTWPFLKEMILGRNSLRYAIRKNRVRVMFFFAVILSFIMNWVLVPRLVTISSNYVKLQQEHRVMKEEFETFKASGLSKEAEKQIAELQTSLQETKRNCENTTSCGPLFPPKTPVQHDVNYVRKRLKSLEE